MALKTYTTSDNKILAFQLSEDIRTIKHVFQKHFIVTGHSTTNDFLTQTIAEKNDIAANIEYKRPLEFVEMVYSILEAGPKRKELFKPHQFVWIIDSVLMEDSFLKKFTKIATYINGEAQKRFALAEKIAALFQSYQEETPELIKAWNDGREYKKEGVSNEDELWQREIWLAVAEKIGHHLPDLTKMYLCIHESLQSEDKQKLLKDKLPSVSFYGNLAYSSELIHLIEKLSEFIDISIFYVAFQSDNNNRLVQNFGQLAKKQRDLLKKFPTKELTGSVQETANMLGALQCHIKGLGKDLSKSDLDDSIVIANCFSVTREVEALYHYLVRQFDLNKELMKRDICVIVPDIEVYAPAIQAFFSNKHFKIDYTLYDTNHKIHASPYLALEAMLQLESDEFTSKKILSLLEYSYIRDKFGINSDLNTLVRAIQLANIRHGFEGNSKIETDLVSWRYGLKRLIYGFCLPPQQNEVEFADTSFFPVDQFEESATREILQLNCFVEALHNWVEKRGEDRTISEWVDFVENETVDLFIDFKEYETNKFKKVLSDLKETSIFHHQKVAFRTMRYFLLSHLEKLESGERKGFGGVRFVSPNTYLSSPVKIFCFLGMNGKDFPRQVTKLSFDLSNDDRITKTEMDKNLFLNIVLSAEEKVYFSYIGQSVKDNSAVPPSTVLEELLEGVKEISTNFNPEKCVVKHPLHSFSNRYNSNSDTNLIQYSLGSLSSDSSGGLVNLFDKTAQKTSPELPVENGKKVIQLQDLIKFVEDPVRHYFNKVLGIYYGDREIELSESELFELDTLQQWIVQDQIVQRSIYDLTSENLSDSFKKKGLLPLGIQGKKEFETLYQAIEKVVTHEQFTDCVKENNRVKKQGEIEIGDFRIKGIVDGIYGDTMLFASASKLKPKYSIRALLQFYFVTLLTDNSVNKLVYLSRDAEKEVLGSQKRKEEIQQILKEWCEWVEMGGKQIVPYVIELNKKHFTGKIAKPVDCLDSNSSKMLVKDMLKDGYSSDYFAKLIEGDKFLDNKEADLFLQMHSSVCVLIEELN